MIFRLAREHEDFRRSVRDFAESEIAPHAAQWDLDHEFPTDLFRSMGDFGLFGLTSSEEYGGAGDDGDFTSLCIAIEEIGRVDQAIGLGYDGAVGLGINPIQSFGTTEQKDQWLPDLVAGRAVAGFGLTESGSGSDAGSLRTRAELVDGEWIINGSKQWITNSGTSMTSLVTVAARTDSTEGSRGISTIIIPNGTPGFTVEKAYNKLGLHASDTHPLTFEDVHVPEANLLGPRGRGFSQFLAVLDDGRVAIAALAVGCIQACLDMSRQYATERMTFGVPIGSKQGVAFQISDVAVMADAARALTYKAAAMKDGGAPAAEYRMAAAVAKLYATESAVTATRIATQVLGGTGFMEEHPIARFYRDAKVLEVGEGTSEVQRIVIARGLGLPIE